MWVTTPEQSAFHQCEELHPAEAELPAPLAGGRRACAAQLPSQSRGREGGQEQESSCVPAEEQTAALKGERAVVVPVLPTPWGQEKQHPPNLCGRAPAPLHPAQPGHLYDSHHPGDTPVSQWPCQLVLPTPAVLPPPETGPHAGVPDGRMSSQVRALGSQFGRRVSPSCRQGLGDFALRMPRTKGSWYCWCDALSLHCCVNPGTAISQLGTHGH